MSWQCVLVAKAANRILPSISKSVTKKSSEMILLLYLDIYDYPWNPLFSLALPITTQIHLETNVQYSVPPQGILCQNKIYPYTEATYWLATLATKGMVDFKSVLVIQINILSPPLCEWEVTQLLKVLPLCSTPRRSPLYSKISKSSCLLYTYHQHN